MASNLPFSKWSQVITHRMLVAAVVHRITFRAHIIVTGSLDKGPPLVGVHTRPWEDDHSEAPTPHARASRAEAP